MQLAARVNRISISPTAAVLAAAEKLRAQGVDLADFGPGEPDFPTPEHIQQAAIRAMKEGRTKYTPTAGIGAAARCDLQMARGAIWLVLHGAGMHRDRPAESTRFLMRSAPCWKRATRF